jgi:hypothetical protein
MGSALMVELNTSFALILSSARDPNAIGWRTLKSVTRPCFQAESKGGRSYLLLAASADRAHLNTRHRDRIPRGPSEEQDSDRAKRTSSIHYQCAINEARD